MGMNGYLQRQLDGRIMNKDERQVEKKIYNSPDFVFLTGEMIFGFVVRDII